MQIHELTQQRLDEQGILQGIKGAVQDYRQGRQDRQQTRLTADTAKKATDLWIKYAENLKRMTPDPARYEQLYKQALTAFVQKNLLQGKRVNDVINAQEITRMIDAMAAEANNPRQSAVMFPDLVKQASMSVANPEQQSLVKVINADPAIVQFRNRDYIINDQGDWAEKVSGRIPDQSFQAFLDQEWSKVVPQSPQPAPPDQSKIEYLPADPQWKNLDGVRGFQGKIMLKDKAGKWFNYNNNQPVEETRPEYIDQLNKLYDRVKPAGASATSGNLDSVLQQLGIDTAKIAELQKTVKADPAVADQLRKTLGL
jgi:hypothetical protein